MPVDRDGVDDLESLGKGDGGRADHRHGPARASEGLSLLPNPPVEGDGQILDDDDTGTGLARRRHWTFNCRDCRVFVVICGPRQGPRLAPPGRAPASRRPLTSAEATSHPSPPNPRPTQT